MENVYASGPYIKMTPEERRHVAAQMGYAVMNGLVRLAPVEFDEAPPILELSADADADAVVEAVLAVAEERRATLHHLRAALVAGSNAEALTLARELVNLP